MKILVRNLERNVTEDELNTLFKTYGKIESCVIVTDAATGKSKGFGFVEMPNPREAIKAIKALNTMKLKGTGIRVKAADEPKKA
ncbi:RNA-binding protein [Acinetobacter sp. MD2(2019)]|uniref:RNA recognition motif domain-containing protein n=1 Tax=Acinetobacter sp. MD2(2019) TaxID=2605273 RepID=UPI002D1E79EC|nr:RNA-binding protein [Acinetobacter sp. MD2(2019)]MEB3753048.1 RNA-binding protein [Acinetobacter sp. MD2(2019)]